MFEIRNGNFVSISNISLTIALCLLTTLRHTDYLSGTVMIRGENTSKNIFARIHNHEIKVHYRVRILVQVTIYRRLLIGRDGYLDQSEAYDIS